MTDASSTPQVIVVAEQEVYDLLAASGARWDLQHRVETIPQMWDDLSGGRLAQSSLALVFSDSILAKPGELEATIAAMAPHAAVFVVAWEPDGVLALLERVRQAAEAQGLDPAAPVFVLGTSSGNDVLDGMREVLDGQVDFPQEWQGAVQEPEDTAAPPAAPAAAMSPAHPVAAPVAAPVQAPVEATPVAPLPSAPSLSDPLAGPPLEGQVTLAVISAKGGSGKSTTAMMVGSQIRQSSIAAGKPLKVVLVDMDTRDGQVASLIGRYVPTALNIRVAKDWDQETILKNLVHDPKLGIDALLAPVRPRTADDVGPDFYRHVIRMLQRTHDVVILDCSVNYLGPLIAEVCLPEATAILMTTTLATTSVQGMARALREITEPLDKGGMGISRDKIGIVVNQSVTDVGMDREQVVQAALRVPIVGAIPLSTRDVLTATNYNRMHLLLKHPHLGPAYHALASACMPGADLPALIAPTPSAETSGSPAAGQAPVTAPVAPPAPKRGLFGRNR